MRRLLPLPVLVLLAGCAAISPLPDAGSHKPLAAYAKDPFVPVNLYLNANEALSARESALSAWVAQRLADSGAFLRVDRGVQRWVYTLQMRYRLEGGWGAADVALRALQVLALGLVPVTVSQTHVLATEVFLEPDPVGKIEYRETVRRRVSLYDLGGGPAEALVAEQLLERTLAECARRKWLPPAREYPPREPARKRGRGQPL